MLNQPSNMLLDRRALLAAMAATTTFEMLKTGPARAQDRLSDIMHDGARQAAEHPSVRWVCTTRDRPWQTMNTGVEEITLQGVGDLHVMLQPTQEFQVIEGFGACFHERGWQALCALPEEQRAAILTDLFAPGVGANLSICRVPIGANDFALDWYSHNETPGDFDMRRFSTARDHKLLIPFIQMAQRYNPRLSLWASPWSPPVWMKTNGHYATAKPRLGLPDNGIRDDQVRQEGQDTFIQDDRYFKAYALYFRRFVEDYEKQGMRIGMVMPQNEFNSAQIFPSCTWTPQGLSRFIPALGEEMAKIGTDVFFGTLERPDEQLFESVFSDPAARPFIRGVGAQWAGRAAVPFIHRAHPELKIWQSEQECGDGRNDWRFARFGWQIMKDFMRSGTTVYNYWNIALDSGQRSRWGWTQNSMISVDMQSGSFQYNHDYYVFKHVSHFVQPGARRIGTISFSGYENQLAFRNPDGRTVVVIQNDLSDRMPIHLTLAQRTYRAVLPPDSFNSFVL